MYRIGRPNTQTLITLMSDLHVVKAFVLGEWTLTLRVRMQWIVRQPFVGESFYIFLRKYFTFNPPRVTALSKYSLISVRNCKGIFTSSKSECESAKRSKNNRKKSKKNIQTIKEIFRFRVCFRSM